MAIVTPEARRHDVDIQLSLPDDSPKVTGDRIQVEQVLLNLFLNGIEAMSECDSARRMLRIGTDAGQNGSLTILVSDSGSGLDEDFLNQIYTPFYTTKPGGLGMGLSICRSIVEAHGGRLWATRHEEFGTTFQFSLCLWPGEWRG